MFAKEMVIQLCLNYKCTYNNISATSIYANCYQSTCTKLTIIPEVIR